MAWTNEQSARLYGINHWGDDYFKVGDNGHVWVYPNKQQADVGIDMAVLVQDLVKDGYDLPLLLRFPDILKDRARRLCEAFNQAVETHEYPAGYTAIYPIKVNQQASVIQNILAARSDVHSIGLEAGSKPELMIVLAMAPKGGTIICNGYKDRDFIRMALMGQKLGHQVFIVIEKESEVELVIEESRRLDVQAQIGLRVRLSSLASSKWADTGGDKGKFGLSASQLISAAHKLKDAGMGDSVQLMHFHMGSQIANIADYRLGFKEAIRYFDELRALGLPLSYVDVGGGLGVDYDGTSSRNASSINYDLNEYADTIVSMLANYCEESGTPAPHILSESGRALTAHHAVLVTNVTDVEGLPEEMPVIDADADWTAPMKKLLSSVNQVNLDMTTELYYRVSQYYTEVSEWYVAGQLSLSEKAIAEQVYSVFCRRLKQALQASLRSQRQVYDALNDRLADKYFCNFSVFQSLPDTWAIGQILPIMPIHRLNEVPSRRAVLQDLTCDSDGKVSNYVDEQSIESSMAVHEVKDGEVYVLGVFMVGAYQEILGDMHNLFGDTDSVNIYVRDEGEIECKEVEEHDTIEDMLRYVHVSPEKVLAGFTEKARAASLSEAECEAFCSEFGKRLQQSSYLSI